MNPERWKQVKLLLDGAIALSPTERQAFLDRSCAGDSELRREVESLLLSHERAGTGFLNTPAVDLQAGSAPAPTRVGRRIGAYDILEEIGHGGMGEVYRAGRADGQYKKEVAIKLVRGGYDTASVLERFRHERQILASLDHPNIARLLDGGTTEEGIPYLVMELIEGTPIDQFCETHGLNITERLRLFLQVCLAVQYAHQRLVIHRDIKPGNILVTKGGVPKLLDFGIAKILDPASSPETTIAGPMTPEYASPEQIRGEAITTATDVYSLGVVLCRLLAGRSPYPAAKARTPHEFARAICEFEPERPSTIISKDLSQPPAGAAPPNGRDVPRPVKRPAGRLHRRLSGDLDTIVLHALRKEPQRRYASVEQFAEDIRRHLEGLPVTASRGSWRYRAGKFAIRHKLGVAATTVILLAVLGGVTATVREARIAAANQRRAEQRFNDVRKLAGSLMFEIHDSIAGLPGATPARKLIVQRSLEYLDSLSHEAAGDVSLQRELANAYERIGLVQGDPNGSNLGDIDGALESFGKSLGIRERIAKVASNENLPDRIALAGIYREMCALNARYLGRIGAALDYCGQALNTAEALYSAAPTNGPVRAELAKDYEANGTVYGQNSTSGNAGDSYAALENHRKALDLIRDLAVADPADLDLSSWQGSLSILTADDLFETGSVSKAIPLYQQATRTFENLTKQSDNPRYSSLLKLAYQRMGDMLLVAGHFEPALTYYRKQLELCLALVASDPKNMEFRTSLVAARATYGHALWRAGRVPEGLDSLQRGLAEIAESKLNDARAKGLEMTIRLWMAGALEKELDLGGASRNYLLVQSDYSRICQSDPRDVEDCLALAGTEDRIARIHMQEGNPAEALTEYQKALAISEPLTGGTRPNLEALYAAVNAYFGMGEVHASLARQSSAGARRNDSWSQSCAWYRKSYAAFLRIPEWLPITPDEFDSRNPKQIQSRLSACRLPPNSSEDNPSANVASVSKKSGANP